MTQKTEKEIDDIARLFRILGNENRIRILLALFQDDEMSAEDLEMRLKISKASLAYHLLILKGECLVADRRIGKKVMFSIPNENAVKMVQIAIMHMKY